MAAKADTKADAETILAAARITAAAELAGALMRSSSKGEWHAAAKAVEREEAAVEAFQRLLARLEEAAHKAKAT